MQELILRPRKNKDLPSELTPSLRRAGDRLKKLIQQAFQTQLQKLWEMGHIIHEVLEKADNVDEARDSLAEYTSLSQRYLSQLRRFYQIFPSPKDIQDLLDLRFRTSGNPITWAHVQKLLTLENRQAMQIAEKACAEDWTPEELQRAIDQVKGQKVHERHGGGRPVRVPVTFSGRLLDLRKAANNWKRNDQAIWRHEQYGFLRSLEELPDSQLNEELLDLLNENLEALRIVEQTAMELQGELQRVRARLEERLHQC
jgi:hypothetical protein